MKGTKKTITMVLSLLFILPSSFAALDCDFNGQAFFYPDYVEESTISVPCTITTNSNVNVSCVGMVLFEGDLISTYPKIEDVEYYGRTSFIEITGETTSESFVFEIPSKDLLHLTTFEWKIICNEPSGISHSDSGTFNSEYPFSEILIDAPMTVGIRDSSKLIAFFFILFIIVVVACIAIKLIKPK